jgi:hypothetical protein
LPESQGSWYVIATSAKIDFVLESDFTLLAEDLKEFPVDRSYFMAIKKRVSLATRINTKLHAKDKVKDPDSI